MAERLAVAAVAAADRRFDQAQAILFAAGGKRKSPVARMRAVERVRPRLVGRGTGHATMPRNGVAHERTQFLIRDLHELQPGR